MENILLKLFFIPFILLLQITEVINTPNRDSLAGSNLEIIQEYYAWDYLKQLPTNRYEFGAALAGDSIYMDTVLTTDAGYCSEGGLQGLEQHGIDACIPDPNWRKRDERFAGQQA